ncbi:uncharacterized protein EI90DRAFT_3279123 [Cantharellus anzutake]|uniref:uncharacterized protein n=1 Tax=Cantharellus anzutake TaxID=1750568 RepID=UPI001906BA20|nr:uncharacterized protein EI90DRAFT_3279123 [Cantharellus anzutake]KAF8340513.1 hypothetical protein EI90DRAFT_3279123 [Cantharellus anzutake]
MSGLAFLVTELQSLASETRRKYPDVRDAAEKSLSMLRASPEQASASLLTDGAQSEELLKPIFMGCATKNPKVVTISLGSLQRLIVMKAVPLSSIPHIVSTVADCMSQGVDVQLRILQTLLSLLTNYSGIHGVLLGDALLLCFRLQESRIAVVSSTAAATLRQLVMLVFDKVVDAERMDEVDEDGKEREKTVFPNGTEVFLSPSSRDAFCVFQDLCLLANSERPSFLSLESLPKTFALELIESVLANYHSMFRKRSELLLLLRHHLSPLLLKALSDKPIFPLTLRSTRVVFLLLKQFLELLETEGEVFLMLFIKVISGDHDNHEAPRPSWMRVLAMEIIRGLCSDAEIVRQIWDRYDGARAKSSSKVFSYLVTALKRLATEKPALLGSSSQIYGSGVSAILSQSTLDLGLSGASGYGIETVAGVVASAANMVGIGSGTGLSIQGASMKLQCIDQLDKADAPAIPELYVYLLALQSLVALTEAFASLSVPLYTSIAIQRPRAAGDSPIRAPPALDISKLPDSESSTQQLRSVYGMIEAAWPATLAALSFFITTTLSDDLFVEVLTGLQSMANVAGVVGLSTPRDAFLTCLSKFAIPSGVVSALDSAASSETPATPRSASVLSAATENLAALANSVGGSGPAASVTPSLSDRNMTCLKVLISTALFLAGSLGSSWFDVLETLQNAEYVLFVKGPSATRRASTGPSGLSPIKSRTASMTPPAAALSVGSPSSHTRSSIMSDIDVESVRAMMNRLFDASKNLDDEAFQFFITALCKLSSEMINMQAGLAPTESQNENSVDDLSSGLLPPRVESPHRRRASGIQLTRNIRGGDFGIARLGSVSKLNIHRLIYRDPALAWNIVVGHLLSTLKNPLAPSPIRLQSAEVLDDILVVVPRNITNLGDQAEMQQRMFRALSEQVIFEPPQFSFTVTEVRRLGLECLHEILQFSAHTLVTGWETIFEVLSSVCIPPPSYSPLPPSPRSPSDQAESSSRPRPPPLSSPLIKSNASLLRIAFQSLTLVCDSIDALSPDNLRLCINTIGQFGTQPDTNIALTAAESLMWGVSDSVQSKRKDSDKEPVYSSLWMFLLSELLQLCADLRTEVRNGAIQTLFRSLQLYGATLSPEMWTECLETIVFALFDSLSSSIRKLHTDLSTSSNTAVLAINEWYNTKSLAFQLVGSVLSEFLISRIIRLPAFAKIWQRFITHITQAALLDNRIVTTAALRSLEASINASRTEAEDLQDASRTAREAAWSSLEAVGSAVANQREASGAPPTEIGATPPFNQDSLLALADVLRVLYVFNGDQWELGRLRQMMFILKAIMTYTKSPEYRPDVDKLTPVQLAVIQAVEAIKLTVRFSPSLVLSDLSEFATLAFVAAFEVESNSGPQNSAASKQVTYIALAKYAMPKLVDLYLIHKTELDIYNDGTLERVLSSYSIPMKLKYDCPAPSKFGSDEPLWKTATTNFLKIVRELGQSIKSFSDTILPEHMEGIWRQALDVFRGALLADCTAVTQFSLEKQDAEEKFDLALLATLEIDVIPYVGDARVPDPVIIQLGKTLQNACVLHDLESHFEARMDSLQRPDNGGKKGKPNGLPVEPLPIFGTTAQANLLPRERFNYWCFDLLFLACSASTQDNAAERQRIAALILPSLLNRCHTVLATYVVDEALRGGVPFPRAREEELLYVLRKLQELRLWHGCLWAAFSNDPSRWSVNVPDIDTTLEPLKMIADATKRSSQAHLFHFYTLLYEIATIRRAPPSMWVASPYSPTHSPSASDSKVNGSKSKEKNKSTVIEVDTRILAKACLRQIGREMGAEI